MAALGVIWADGLWNNAAWNTTIWEQGGQITPGVQFDINGSFIPYLSSVSARTFTPSWVDELPAGAVLDTVTHTAPSPLVKVSESNTSTTSSVRISGALHGKTYLITCEALLSTGDTIYRRFPVRCFNG